MSGTLHEELNTFYCCRRHEIAIKVKKYEAVRIAEEI
jgi:hypothetical protein